MAVNKDKNSYTMIFAVIMVLVVGTLLAGFSSGLKPMIKANEKFEKQQNILYAMGVNDNQGTGDVAFITTDRVADAFKTYIKEQLIIEGPNASQNDKAYLIDVKKEGAKAKKAGYQRKLPLFIGEKDGEKLYIMPVRGKGLWDAIWGFVAVDKTMTVQGVYFDHKGETPGLGANIKYRFFMDDFKGEHLLDASGDFKGIRVAKGNNDPKNDEKTDYEVDAIAGATITGDGVSAMIKSDLKLYVDYFKTLKQ